MNDGLISKCQPHPFISQLPIVGSRIRDTTYNGEARQTDFQQRMQLFPKGVTCRTHSPSPSRPCFVRAALSIHRAQNLPIRTYTAQLKVNRYMSISRRIKGGDDRKTGGWMGGRASTWEAHAIRGRSSLDQHKKARPLMLSLSDTHCTYVCCDHAHCPHAQFDESFKIRRVVKAIV